MYQDPDTEGEFWHFWGAEHLCCERKSSQILFYNYKDPPGDPERDKADGNKTIKPN